MYCSKCKYFSFDHLASCPKCGQDWNRERKKLGLDWIIQTEQSWIAASNNLENETLAELNQEELSAPVFIFDKEEPGQSPRTEADNSLKKESDTRDTPHQPAHQPPKTQADPPATEPRSEDLFQEIEYPDLEFIEDESDKQQKS